MPSVCASVGCRSKINGAPGIQPVTAQRAAWLAFTEPHRACDFGLVVGGVLTRHSTLTGTMLLGECAVWTCEVQLGLVRVKEVTAYISSSRLSALLCCVAPRTTTTTSLNACAMHLQSSQFPKQAHVTNTALVSVRRTVCLAPRWVKNCPR